MFVSYSYKSNCVIYVVYRIIETLWKSCVIGKKIHGHDWIVVKSSLTDEALDPLFLWG